MEKKISLDNTIDLLYKEKISMDISEKPLLEINSDFFERLKFLSKFVYNAKELLNIAKANHTVNDEVSKAVISLYDNNKENIHKNIY